MFALCVQFPNALHLVFHWEQLICLKIYCFVYFSSIPVSQFSKENNLSAKSISVSDIILFIHLLHLWNITKHFNYNKTSYTNNYKTRINGQSFLALISSPFYLMKSKFCFLRFNELNRRHRLKFLTFMLHEPFATTPVTVHYEPLISSCDTYALDLITSSDQCIWDTFGCVTGCFRTGSYNIIKQIIFLTKIL